ncbi:transcription termination factor MTERF8, chloroplastic [Elaeis guineensis]|uniref:Transcription termination factor MTERF6, chloroplastic/mitochondrial n=1 Tax=Elaeis guineensis var. tenera TaxID=51953 RepID=A0A6I9S4R0_ELAGV|nr:transcription termination factor MTERF6, chloroplastic/mitochondrial [Elaeis guineensis]
MSLAKPSSAFLRGSGTRTNILLPLFHRHRLDDLLFSSSATAAAAAADEGEKSSQRCHVVVEYLINSCGLSSAEASKASKSLAHLKSTERIDAFLGSLRSHGFDDASLRTVVSRYPKLLNYSAERNLAPKFQFFRDLGFSGSDLSRLFLSSANVFGLSLHRTIQSRLDFWMRLLGSKEHLVKLLKSNLWVINNSIERVIMPNLSLLRECGISDQRTAWVLRRTPTFICRSPKKFRALIERVEELGVPRSSGMFLWALWALSRVSEAKFNAKLQVMRSFGLSEVESFAALRKDPRFLTNSEEMLSAKMTFLVKEVGFEPAEVAFRPKLLTFSLEKRLMPRHRIMQMLKASGLPCGKKQFTTVLSPSEKVFREKYVNPHKEKVPGLLEMYVAACGKGSTI